MILTKIMVIIPYPGNVFKTLPKMWLYSCWIFGLRQDLKKFIIRQEVETWEGCSLGLQVFTQSLLDLIQKFVAFLQVLKKSGIRTQRYHLKVIYNQVLLRKH